MSFIMVCLNFFIFAGVVVWLAGPKLKPLAKEKYNRIRDQLDVAKKVLSEAQQKEAESTRALNALESEKRAVAKEYADLSAKKSLEIVNAGQKTADALLQDVGARKARLQSEMKSEIKKEVVESVIQKAETVIKSRLTGDEKARVRSELAKDFEVSLR